MSKRIEEGLVQVHTRVLPEDAQFLRVQAAQRGVSLSQILRDILKRVREQTPGS